MIKTFYFLLADYLWKRIAQIIDRAERKLRRFLIGTFLIVSGTLFIHTGILFLLLVFFFLFSQTFQFVLPSLWTALVGLGAGFLLLLIGRKWI